MNRLKFFGTVFFVAATVVGTAQSYNQLLYEGIVMGDSKKVAQGLEYGTTVIECGVEMPALFFAVDCFMVQLIHQHTYRKSANVTIVAGTLGAGIAWKFENYELKPDDSWSATIEKRGVAAFRAMVISTGLYMAGQALLMRILLPSGVISINNSFIELLKLIAEKDKQVIAAAVQRIDRYVSEYKDYPRMVQALTRAKKKLGGA